LKFEIIVHAHQTTNVTGALHSTKGDTLSCTTNLAPYNTFKISKILGKDHKMTKDLIDRLNKPGMWEEVVLQASQRINSQSEAELKNFFVKQDLVVSTLSLTGIP
jgi:hypothetical protein